MELKISYYAYNKAHVYVSKYPQQFVLFSSKEKWWQDAVQRWNTAKDQRQILILKDILEIIFVIRTNGDKKKWNKASEFF